LEKSQFLSKSHLRFSGICWGIYLMVWESKDSLRRIIIKLKNLNQIEEVKENEIKIL